MYTIIGTVTARPDTREELLTLLAAQVVPTRAEAGCVNYDFHVDQPTLVSLSSTKTGPTAPRWTGIWQCRICNRCSRNSTGFWPVRSISGP